MTETKCSNCEDENIVVQFDEVGCAFCLECLCSAVTAAVEADEANAAAILDAAGYAPTEAEVPVGGETS